jgi:hypothetical protein
VSKREDKAALKLVTAEAQDVEKRFRELYDRANKRLPTGAAGPATIAAGEALEKLLRDNRAARLWERIAGPLSVARAFALEHSPGTTPGLRACWGELLRSMGDDLAGENPSEVETLLAQHAALCWLRLAEVELLYSAKVSGQITLTLGMYFEKRLSMAQRRFTRACETLERVRMMRRRAGLTGASEEAERRRA